MLFIHSTKTLLCACLLLSPVGLLSEETGPETRSTGGNFPEETTCARAQCHNTTPNIGPGSFSVTMNGAPIDQYSSYTPNEIVDVVVRVAEEGMQRWGFQMTARGEDGCLQAGDFAVSSDPSVKLSFDSATPEGCGGSTIQFPSHIFPKAGGSGGAYTFQWTAPPPGFGQVRFAAAGNAANGDIEKTGDSIYDLEAQAAEGSGGGGLPMPAISSGGVILATGKPIILGATSNAIFTAFGANFAAPGTSILAPEVNPSGVVTDNLGNTCVEVNGNRSPMFAVVETQVNFQVSHKLKGVTGPVSVVVIQNCGKAAEQRTPAQQVTFASAAPGFFVFPQFGGQDGKNPIAALHGGGPNIIAPDGLFPNTSPPGAPVGTGQVASLFFTGGGVTNPEYFAGEVPILVSPSSPVAGVTATVQLTIGGVAVPAEDIAYIGVAPCCAGLYQLVVKVPAALAAGNHEVILTLNGVASPSGPFLPVAAP